MKEILFRFLDFRLLSIFIIVSHSNISIAQSSGSSGQVWVGLRGSANSTSISVDESYKVLEGKEDSEKEYENITALGGGVGVVITYELNDFVSFSFQPYYNQIVFGYNTLYNWETSSDDISLKTNFDHSLDYLNFPVLVRFEYPISGGSGSIGNVYTSSGKKGTFTPFVEIGGQYSRMIGSRKRIESTTTEGEASVMSTSLINTYNLLNHDQWALVGGVGFSYDLGGLFRIALSGTYTYGLNNVANGKTRYSNDELTQRYYDAFDDFKWRNVGVELHLLFPIKFMLSGNFRAL